MTPQQLRMILAAADVSQLELARRLGVNGRTVRRWVAGATPLSDERADQILSAVGLRVRAA
jgi:transcriptional regulator with XRE-family HTH domain